MSESPPGTSSATPKWKPLEPNQRRVLGVIIEKAKTTPAAYPITVNAIVLGCNQKSNRAPLMALDDFDVEKALGELGALGAVSEIDWLGRVAKYKHHAYEWLGVSKVELAVMAELLLRGEQTLGELRVRAARMEPIADLPDLRPIVDALLQRRLMIELTPPGRGQMVTHNLYEARELAELRGRISGHPRGAAVAEGGARAVQPSAEIASERGAAPFSEIAELREEVARLRQHIHALEARIKAALG
jgi:uncharacterized protein YceH (UPF0502 family)